MKTVTVAMGNITTSISRVGIVRAVAFERNGLHVSSSSCYVPLTGPPSSTSVPITSTMANQEICYS